MWYRFEEGNTVGIPRVMGYQVAFYDMTRRGSCFDESFLKPDDIGNAITYVETVEDEGNNDRCRVFVYFDNGDKYELKLEKIEKGRRCSGFYD
jgi:hypothetical protein